VDENLIICNFSSNDLWNFISDDDTFKSLKIWTDDDCRTNDSTFRKAVSFRRKTQGLNILVPDFKSQRRSHFRKRVGTWKNFFISDLIGGFRFNGKNMPILARVVECVFYKIPQFLVDLLEVSINRWSVAEHIDAFCQVLNPQ
jgi:hypothetical protein